MKVTTGHILLILYMEYCQLLYDITFFFSNVDCGYYITVAANFFQLTFGIGGSLFSNWIAYVILHIVIFRQKFDVFEKSNIIIISSLLPGFIDAIIFCVATIPEEHQSDDLVNIAILDIYYYTRFLSIIVNFVLVIIILYKVDLMSSKTINKSDQEIAIRTVSRRMIFYPIIQAISRSGYSWYELQYGAAISPSDSSADKYACLLFLTIITPIVSLGYLIIFLVMQPNAYEHFVALMTCRDFHTITPKEEHVVFRNTGSKTSSFHIPGFKPSISAPSQSDTTDGTQESKGGGTDNLDVRSAPSELFRESSFSLRDTRNEEELLRIIEGDQLFEHSRYGRSTLTSNNAFRQESFVVNSIHQRPSDYGNSSIAEMTSFSVEKEQNLSNNNV